MSERKTLEFTHPIFNHGLNTTVRRGDKWAQVRPGDIISLRAVAATGGQTPLWNASIYRILVTRFSEIRDEDIQYEHDPACRNRDELFNVMRKCYPNFKRSEIVTVLTFYAHE